MILWVSHKFGSAHKFRSIWLASVRLAFCLHSSVVIYHELHKLPIMQNCPWNKLIDVPRSCWKRKSFENFNLPFACCRISQWDVQHLILVDSDDSPWGRLHGQIETSCNFHSNHSRAGTKWPLSISYLILNLSAECEESFTSSRTASKSLGAPGDIQ